MRVYRLGLVGVFRPGVFDLTPPFMLQDTESPPDFTQNITVLSVSLTEKILTELSSSSQMNLALRLVRRSSSIRGGFTNTTYGLNSNV